MKDYLYTGIYDHPNIATYNDQHELISGIHYDVANGDMTDKSLIGCDWDQGSGEMKVWFENTLSSADEDKLDIIVDNNT